MDYSTLKSFVDSKMSIREISKITNKGPTTIRYWLKKHNLKNHIEKNKEQGIQDLTHSDITHIIDYLNSDDAPKKLKKMSVKDARNNAQKWTESLIKKTAQEQNGDVQIIKDFGDGFKIVKEIEILKPWYNNRFICITFW